MGAPGPSSLYQQGRSVLPTACGPRGQSRRARLTSVVRALWAEAMRKTSV